MAIIVKCDPLTLEPDGTCVVNLWLYESNCPRVGEDAFIWTSEMNGGEGLIYRATVREANELGRGARLRLAILDLSVRQRLTKDDLWLFRDTNGAMPIERIARKLYWNAKNKIVTISDGEAEFLAGHFDVAEAAR